MILKLGVIQVLIFMILTFLFFFSFFLKILGSPQRLYDLAGPSSTESEPRKRSISKRKSHLDLLKLYVHFPFGSTGQHSVFIEGMWELSLEFFPPRACLCHLLSRSLDVIEVRLSLEYCAAGQANNSYIFGGIS